MPHYPTTIYSFSEKHFQRKEGQLLDANTNYVRLIFEKPNSEVLVKAHDGTYFGYFRPSDWRKKKVEEAGVTHDASKYLDKKTFEFITPKGQKLKWLGAAVCVDSFLNCLAIYERRSQDGKPRLAITALGQEVIGSIMLSLMVLEQRIYDKTVGEVVAGVSGVAELAGSIASGNN